MRTFAIAALAAMSLLQAGCGGAGNPSAQQQAAVPFRLIATNVVGRELFTETVNGRTRYIGEVNQPIVYVLAATPTRGGLDPGMTELRVSYADSPGFAPRHEFDDPVNPMRVVIHERGLFRVELLVGLADGNYAVLATCYVRLV